MSYVYSRYGAEEVAHRQESSAVTHVVALFRMFHFGLLFLFDLV